MDMTFINTDEPVFGFYLRPDLGDEFLPTQSDPLSTGFDVRSSEPGTIEVNDKEVKLIRLGFHMAAPPGWWMELRPRSSTFVKKQLHCLYGVIDEGYEGEVCMAVRAHLGCCCPIQYGDRIGQLVPVKRPSVALAKMTKEEWEKFKAGRANQRTGGFGSTGV